MTTVVPILFGQLGADRPIEIWRGTPKEPYLSSQTLANITRELGERWFIWLEEPMTKADGANAKGWTPPRGRPSLALSRAERSALPQVEGTWL